MVAGNVKNFPQGVPELFTRAGQTDEQAYIHPSVRQTDGWSDGSGQGCCQYVDIIMWGELIHPVNARLNLSFHTDGGKFNVTSQTALWEQEGSVTIGAKQTLLLSSVTKVARLFYRLNEPLSAGPYGSDRVHLFSGSDSGSKTWKRY